MKKMNWDKVRSQKNARKYGILIDKTLGHIPRKTESNPKQGRRRNSDRQANLLFAPKITDRSEHERMIHYRSLLLNLTLRVQTKKAPISKKFTENSIRKFNEYTKRLHNSLDDPELKCVLQRAESAMSDLMSKPTK
jgi:hypothetical protein